MKTRQALAALAAAALTTQPALAADDFRNLETRAEHRSAAFAGARVRLPFGGGGGERRERASARLQLGVDHIYEDRRSAAPATVYRTAGVELGFSGRRSAPTLFVGGAPARDIERRLGISTAGGIAIGAGVALVVLVAAAAASGPPDIFGEEE
jgi:hypothetical protein